MVIKMAKIKKKKWSFSQKIYIYNMIFVAIICIVSFVLIGCSGFWGIIDLTPIGAIVAASFAELATHTGFYIWKAKFENGRKYKDVNLMNDLSSDVDSAADSISK